MAYALFYNKGDMAAIISEFTNNTKLSKAEQDYALRVWNGGLSTWESAPIAPKPYGPGPENDPTYIYVINGTGLLKPDLVSFLRKIAQDKRNNSYYLESLARDIEVTAVEPWPPQSAPVEGGTYLS